MDDRDEVCLCFHVPLRKIRAFLVREDPPAASLVGECLGAGTGCGWCVPFLEHLHRCHRERRPIDLRVSPEQYINQRARYRSTGARPGPEVSPGVGPAGDGPDGEGPARGA